jgi:hypothetical protein
VLFKNGIFNPNWVYDKENAYDKELLELTTTFIIELSNLAMDQKMDIIVKNLSISLGAISEIAARNEDIKLLSDVLFSIENIFNDSIDRNMDVAAKEAANSMVNLEKAVVIRKLKGLKVLEVLSILRNFVEKVIDKGDDVLASSLFKKFSDAVNVIVEHKWDVETVYAIIFMEELRKKAIEKDLNIVAALIITHFGKIMGLGLEYSNDIAIEKSIDAIMDITKKVEEESFITKTALITPLKKIVKVLEVLKSKVDDKKAFEDNIEEINRTIDKLEKDILPVPGYESYFDI